MDKETLIKKADAIFDKYLTEVDNWNSAIFYTDKQAFLNELIEAITVTHCCKSDSELLFCSDCNVKLKEANGFCPKYIECEESKTK